MNKPGPIHIGDLLPKLDHLLINFLAALPEQDWERQTIVPKWKIKDIAAHLLDGNLRSMSILRDRYEAELPNPVQTYADLVGLLNQLNSDWIKASRRLSPRVILDLLRTSGQEYCNYLLSLNPYETAKFSVRWAGENESKNWFHIAREYTEKWHHQQQIRQAVGEEKELIKTKWYYPYLDTSVRALPFHYREVKGKMGDLIKFVIVGASEKSWFLQYHGSWDLYTSTTEIPNCEVRINDQIAWRIFTKGISKDEAIRKSLITGKRNLGLKIFDMVAVMA